MKNWIFLVSILLTHKLIQATNTTETKTKRGLIGQTFYYGEPHTTRYIQTPIYQDSTSSAATHPTSGYYNTNNRLVIVQNPGVPIKPEGDATKQVTIQQILYDYQQTPQNIVSNIPVNQPFQTATEQRPEVVQPQTHFVNQPNVLNVEPNQYSGIITPVQHGAVIQHGQRYNPKLLYNPYNIQTNNPQNTLQQRTPYANPNILYQQPLHNYHNNNNNNNHVYAGITVRPQTYLNFQQRHQVVTQKPFKPSPLIPITYKHNYQSHPAPIITTTPAPAPAPARVKPTENEDTEDKEDVLEEQEEEEDSEDRSNYEEEDEEDFKPSHFSRYRYEDEDDEDHEHYREDDEDEDNTRSYTRYVKKSPKKSAKGKKEPRYHKNDHYKFKKGYQKNKEYSSAYKSEPDYITKQPKNQYKSYKYYKSSSNHLPRKEVFEGHQSQNVPVIHNKKVIHQEKWLITKQD